VTTSHVRNESLRLAIEQAGLTYDQLAADIRRIAAEAGKTLRTNRSAIAHWIAGRPPSPGTSAYIAEALSRRLGRQLSPADLSWEDSGHDNGPDTRLGLGIGPDPVDIVRRIGEADINRRRILTGAAYSVAAAALPLGFAQAAESQERTTTLAGRKVGESDIDAVRSMLKAFTTIDERQGGLHGHTSVVLRRASASLLLRDGGPACRHARHPCAETHRPAPPRRRVTQARSTRWRGLSR
jgi:hypothetical protein